MSNYLPVCNLKMCSISYYPSKHERQFILRDSDISFWIGTEAWDHDSVLTFVEAGGKKSG